MLNTVFLRTKLGWEDFRSLREKWLTAIQLPRFWNVSLISGHPWCYGHLFRHSVIQSIIYLLLVRLLGGVCLGVCVSVCV